MHLSTWRHLRTRRKHENSKHRRVSAHPRTPEVPFVLVIIEQLKVAGATEIDIRKVAGSIRDGGFDIEKSELYRRLHQVLAIDLGLEILIKFPTTFRMPAPPEPPEDAPETAEPAPSEPFPEHEWPKW
jgi:hypothetical protein